MIKALTIWQPYSGLIAVGEKHYETRSWNTKYRGPIAIHAAMRDPVKLLRTAVYSVLKRFALNNPALGALEDLPRGAIVAVADLIDVWVVEQDVSVMFLRSLDRGVCRELSEKEIAFGAYWPGRYAWELANVRKLKNPIPCKGKQGFWTFDGEIKI